MNLPHRQYNKINLFTIFNNKILLFGPTALIVVNTLVFKKINTCRYQKVPFFVFFDIIVL